LGEEERISPGDLLEQAVRYFEREENNCRPGEGYRKALASGKTEMT